MAGVRIRREIWRDKWLFRQGHLWYIVEVIDRQNRLEGVPFIVCGTDFTKDEFRAHDWTDEDPQPMLIPEVESFTLYVDGRIDDDWRITVDGTVIYYPRHLPELYNMNPRITTVTQDASLVYGVKLAVGQVVKIEAVNIDQGWQSHPWTATVDYVGGWQTTATGGFEGSGNDGDVRANPVYRDAGTFTIALPDL
jgi:hypothetical protein